MSDEKLTPFQFKGLNMFNAALVQHIKRVSFFIVMICVANTLPMNAYASDPNAIFEKKILISLFPGSTVGTYKSVLGRDSVSEVVNNITLRGMKGFIPIEKTISIKLSSSLSVIVFPIYLHNASLSQSSLIDAVPDADPSKEKLVQIIFYNHKDGKLFGKPPEFPLRSTGWACGGDICDNLEIVDLEPIKNSSTSVVFKYTEGVSSYRLRVLALDETVIKSSEAYNYGDLGGESGILASTEYTGWAQAGDTITATKNSVCARFQEVFCRSIGLSPGSLSMRVLMLNIHPH